MALSSGSTPGSTVRSRRKTSLTSTQRFLPIAEIRNDTVLLKNGGLRAILEVEALNFNLKSETEQQGIIAGYGNFVNTIGFPVQIFIRSSKTNIDDYLADLLKVADTLPAVDLGGGATGFLSDRVGLSWDVRRFRSIGGRSEGRGVSFGRQRLSFWRATMAVAIRY